MMIKDVPLIFIIIVHITPSFVTFQYSILIDSIQFMTMLRTTSMFLLLIHLVKITEFLNNDSKSHYFVVKLKC